MTAFLTLITLLAIKKPFLDDAGFIHSANRAGSGMNTLYKSIELDEIEDLPIKPPCDLVYIDDMMINCF